MSIPKGTKFSRTHRRHMSEARYKSPAVKAHNLRMREVMKGRHPERATATKMANVAIRRLGIDPAKMPEMHKAYFEFYLRQLQQTPKVVVTI